MIKKTFNDNWKVLKMDGGILGPQIMGYDEGKSVTLPHDAMIEERQKYDCPNSVSTGYYPGGVYRYTKRFFAPDEWRNKTISVEFEGSYMNTRVYLNGDYMGSCANGYSNFNIDLDKSLLYGEENELENSRSRHTERRRAEPKNLRKNTFDGWHPVYHQCLQRTFSFSGLQDVNQF